MRRYTIAKYDMHKRDTTHTHTQIFRHTTGVPLWENGVLSKIMIVRVQVDDVELCSGVGKISFEDESGHLPFVRDLSRDGNVADLRRSTETQEVSPSVNSKQATLSRTDTILKGPW
jgi:hypothetical protein